MGENEKKETASGEADSKPTNTHIVKQENKSVNPQPSYFNLNTWRAMREMANVFFQSKALPAHIQNAAQLMVVMQAGKELGMFPMESITNLYLINGKVTLQGSAMMSKVLRAGVKVQWILETDREASVKFSGLGRPEYTATFTMDEAVKAGLTGKDVWKKYPKNMLRWRAFTNGARLFCPDIIQGLYMMEEIAANVDMSSDGEFIEVKSSPTPTPPPSAENAITPPLAVKPSTIDSTTTSPDPGGRPASPAQLSYISKIMTEKNLTWEDDLRMPGPENLTSQDASALITRLQGMPKRIQPV